MSLQTSNPISITVVYCSIQKYTAVYSRISLDPKSRQVDLKWVVQSSDSSFTAVGLDPMTSVQYQQ